MTTGSRFQQPYFDAFDGNGKPRAGAKLAFYLTGTTTPATTYSDATLATPNTNPVVADANGVFPAVFLDPTVTYKAILSTSADVQVWSADPIYSFPTSFRGALVKRTTVLSIPNTTSTAVAWDGEEFDTDAFHSLVTQTSRLTVPAGVTYVRLTAGMQWVSNATGIRTMAFNKNGSGFAGNSIQIVSAATDNPGRATLASPPLAVVAGDYFELVVTQTSGGALNLDAQNPTYFGIEVVK